MQAKDKTENWKIGHIVTQAMIDGKTRFISSTFMEDVCEQGLNLSGRIVETCSFDFRKKPRADLRNANFKDSSLKGSIFNNVDLRGADFTGANMIGCILFDCLLDDDCMTEEQILSCVMHPMRDAIEQVLIEKRKQDADARAKFLQDVREIDAKKQAETQKVLRQKEIRDMLREEGLIR